MSEHLPLLAQNLTKWRTRRGYSVSALARAAEISKSTISELERGLGNPSLDTLWALARTLNVPLGGLFVENRGTDQVEIIRYEEAPVLTSDDPGHLAKLLAGWRAAGEIEVSIVELQAGTKRQSSGNSAGVIERLICIQGNVEIGSGDRVAVLSSGDLISFPADQPHYYHAVGAPARVLVVQQYPPEG